MLHLWFLAHKKCISFKINLKPTVERLIQPSILNNDFEARFCGRPAF